VSVQYGSGSVLAFEATDLVCFDDESKICTESTFANVVV